MMTHSAARGRFSTKINIRGEGFSKPVTFTLTSGVVHDSKAFATLMGTRWFAGFQTKLPTRIPGNTYSIRSSINARL
ncbi:hypothetical protein [Azospirillum thermophilum]|uniref:Uncharacterized protein n=1 Tax=Azospirillum thermophilum TaxID=2202148 RepID=A0A2S2CLB0_9PROT|nr:hypothetical protein [Azospirillum thermophilum]AWK85160.1 hypothetical protein DEW08_02265 [Azospirillum thermophilum]